MAVYSLVVLPQAKWQTFLLAYLLWPLSGVGITGGCHRLWAHRAFVAHWTVRLYLMLAASTANQGCIYHWVRDHRVHHKNSETDGDPHNAQRGFFFAHMGWLYVQKVCLKCIGCFFSHSTDCLLITQMAPSPFFSTSMLSKRDESLTSVICIKTDLSCSRKSLTLGFRYFAAF